MKYAFIKQHEDHHPAKLMCQVMGIHPSGYYAWKKQPVSARAKDNQRLLGLIKQSWLESGCVYGYRKVYDDMMDLSETCSMSRRGNCHDNAAAERFFQLLKRERVKRKIYKTREDARRDTFDYIELFFNPKRKHGYNGNLSPAEFEKRYFVKLGSV